MVRHFGYGLGSIFGLMKLIKNNYGVKKKNRERAR